MRADAADAKTRTLAASLGDQVAERIQAQADAARQQGRMELSFDLHPPEMGRLRLNLSAQDHHLNVRLWADNDQAKQLLGSQVDALKQKLADAGVSLGSFNVGRDGSGSRLPYKAPESFLQSAGSARNDAKSSSAAIIRWGGSSGSVDLMA